MNVIPIAAAVLLMFQGAAAPSRRPESHARRQCAGPSRCDRRRRHAWPIRARARWTPGTRSSSLLSRIRTSPASSRPIGTHFASKNGETVTFTNVTSPIDVFAVYHEKGSRRRG